MIPLFEAKGFQVTAVQNPLTSFPEDVDTTRRFLAAQSGPVILVGHSTDSYGSCAIAFLKPSRTT
ncbi:MAG TPA: hypothetical protein VKD70_02310 [Candidatus Acidoferrum sp.]|nr:hypothetical protein [Candidatus Acidoferrum sp.]